MAKSDKVKAYIRSTDGTIYGDKGKGLQELSVKGATSEKLISFELEADSPIIRIDNIPTRDMLKVIFDFSSLPSISGIFDCSLRFNDDTSPSYLSAGLAGNVARVLLARAAAGSSTIAQGYGTIGFTNQANSPKLGNGSTTLGRGIPSLPNLGVPLFSWNNTSALVQTITLLGVTDTGATISGYRFLAGSKVLILGRNF